MANLHKQWIFGAAWVITAIAIWLAAVPSLMSLATFAWLNAAAVAVGTGLVMLVRSSTPARSIAQVLYDAEHQTGSGR